MTKILKYIKSQKTIYVPSLWLGVLVVSYFFPQYTLAFSIGTAWGVLWMIAYNWFHDK
jgi:uncharacterized membrane protein YdjX (TVP38/TMEM64 family)